MLFPVENIQHRLRRCVSGYLIRQTPVGNGGRIIKKLQKMVTTAVMMFAIVSIYNCARFVCIITDPEEPRFMVYRVVTGVVVLLGAVLIWMLL